MTSLVRYLAWTGMILFGALCLIVEAVGWLIIEIAVLARWLFFAPARFLGPAHRWELALGGTLWLALGAILLIKRCGS